MFFVIMEQPCEAVESLHLSKESLRPEFSAGFSTLQRVRCVQSCPSGFFKNAPVIIYNIKVAALK